MKNHFLLLSTVCFLFSCGMKESETVNTDPLVRVLASEDPKIKRVMDSLDHYAVQIKYTHIERDGEKVFFEDYDFQVDSTNYFYPASTVKFPIALLALSKLNTLPCIKGDQASY